MLTWEEIDRRIDCIAEYAVIIAELKSSGSFEGSRFHQLPTFEYFYKNCVLDRGGKYDFTALRYKSSRSFTLDMPTSIHGRTIGKEFVSDASNKTVIVVRRWNMWMGSEFGHVEEITVT